MQKEPIKAKELTKDQLKNVCGEHVFPFETTKDYDHTQEEIIGQSRAVSAMEFGLSVMQDGYNLFVVGPSGTGRTTFTKSKINALAKDKSIPYDWCYVYNFDNPDRPMAIPLQAGEGHAFQQEMIKLLKEINSEIRRAFSSDEFENKKREILQEFEGKSEEYWKALDDFAQKQNFSIERTPTGINTYPLRFGRPLKQKEYQMLSEDLKKEVQAKSKLVEEEIEKTILQIQKIEREIKNTLDDFLNETAQYATHHLFDGLFEKYKKEIKVVQYLNDYAADVVEHFGLFLKKENETPNVLEALNAASKEDDMIRYQVNVVVDHRRQSGAPVIYETNPTYNNLLGKIEYKGALGNWVTDFTHIKPGAFHLANGGYLIMQATELLRNPYAWDVLKRALKTGAIQIESLMEDRAAMATAGIKPEPIPFRAKVILIGSPYTYDMLSMWDEDFHKLFKVKVEFDVEMKRDDEHLKKMATFVKEFAENEGLLPFHRRALAQIVDYSSRLVSDQRKLSTRFQEITKVLVESSYWAQKENADYVDAPHIKKALHESALRSNRVAETIRDAIAEGTIMVDTDGWRVGQINGLAVIGGRDYIFGVPSRITAQTYVGARGIINIERETSLSGEIHSKGLLILSGYLSGVFAQNKPLPLSASITFEQTYNMIDGDSASSTELYVLLSSLARAPIRQGIAVTGSVNQWGEIQPIGGVNEKIEGFFQVCKVKGLTGEQGVIIPHQNIKNLMLNDDVVHAVEQGLFHIYAVKTVSEGIEILTGVEAGVERLEDGTFKEGTIYRRVSDRLDLMYKTAVKASENVKKANEKNLVQKS